MKQQEDNRAKHIAVEGSYIKGISLYDIDSTIADYMSDVIIPDVKEKEKTIKVPLIYGNAERWNTARKEGYLRDKRGQIQIPLVMFKRNGIDSNDSLRFFNEQLFVPSYRKYSQKNRYDRFSLLNKTKPRYEMYNVRVPEYITVTYEVSVWTSYTEQMNKIIEAFRWAGDRYWGKEDSFRFKVQVESLSTEQELGEGSERIVRTDFTMVANAYLLPEHYGNEVLTQKRFTTRKVVVGMETDMTTQEHQRTRVSSNEDYQKVLDFVGLNGSQEAERISDTQVKLRGVEVPEFPSALENSFNKDRWFKVYIDNVYIPSHDYTYEVKDEDREVIFTFTNPEISISETQTVIITGKFEQI